MTVNISECSNLLAEIRAGTVWKLLGPRHLQSSVAVESKQMGRRYGGTVDCFW